MDFLNHCPLREMKKNISGTFKEALSYSESSNYIYNLEPSLISTGYPEGQKPQWCQKLMALTTWCIWFTHSQGMGFVHLQGWL